MQELSGTEALFRCLCFSRMGLQRNYWPMHMLRRGGSSVPGLLLPPDAACCSSIRGDAGVTHAG